MLKHPDQRVGVFIDTANMYHSAKNLFQSNVNYGAILDEVIGGRKLIRAIAYVIKSGGGEEDTFYGALSKQGFEIKSKDLQVFAGGMKKADWDVGLAVDTIKLADHLDSVVIVSGDGDYTPLVTYLKENKGCLVEVAAFRETTSSRLIAEADDYLDLSEQPDLFLLGKGRGGPKKATHAAGRATSARKKNAVGGKTAAGEPKRKRRVFF